MDVRTRMVKSTIRACSQTQGQFRPLLSMCAIETMIVHPWAHLRGLLAHPVKGRVGDGKHTRSLGGKRAEAARAIQKEVCGACNANPIIIILL